MKSKITLRSELEYQTIQSRNKQRYAYWKQVPKYTLTLIISDGLFGFGSHKIYKQFEGIPQFNTKNFILFAYKVVSIIESIGNVINSNQIPNSRLCQTGSFSVSEGNEEKVKFLMDVIVNLDVASIEKDGLALPEGKLRLKFSVLVQCLMGKC